MRLTFENSRPEFSNKTNQILNRIFLIAFIVIAVTVTLCYFLYETNNFDYVYIFGNNASVWTKIRNGALFPQNFVPETTQRSWRYCDVFNSAEGGKKRCGKLFNALWKPYLEWFNLSDQQVSQMTEQDDVRILSKDPVFVTAISDNHVGMAFKYVIPSFRRLTKQFLIYDLGLSESNLAKLRNMTDVHIRTFDYSTVPSYFRNLFEYRWKSLVIADALRDFEAVFYADAHFSYDGESQLPSLLQKVRGQANNDSIYCHAFLLQTAFHSIFAATAPGMYDYFPINQTESKRVPMGSAGIQLVYFTKDVRSNIFKWWVLCSLEEECMVPRESKLTCKFESDTFNKYANCNRYDQSAINILLAIRNSYVHQRFILNFGQQLYDA